MDTSLTLLLGLIAPLLLTLFLLAFYGNYLLLKRIRLEQQKLRETNRVSRGHKRLYVIHKERE